jgi:hypothetical protein
LKLIPIEFANDFHKPPGGVWFKNNFNSTEAFIEEYNKKYNKDVKYNPYFRGGSNYDSIRIKGKKVWGT